MKQPHLKLGVESLVPLSAIKYLKSKGNYTVVFTLTGSQVSSSTLKVLKARLVNQPFILIRRGLLVHKLFIEKVENDAIAPQMTLTTGETFSISRRIYSKMKMDLLKYSNDEL